MECWNIGIIGKNLFKLLKTPFLQLRSAQAHPSFLPSETFFYFTGAIIPLLHYSDWGEAPKF
jgi:hypothetical protein